jgi:hypothetical protein
VKEGLKSYNLKVKEEEEEEEKKEKKKKPELKKKISGLESNEEEAGIRRTLR